MVDSIETLRRAHAHDIFTDDNWGNYGGHRALPLSLLFSPPANRHPDCNRCNLIEAAGREFRDHISTLRRNAT